MENHESGLHIQNRYGQSARLESSEMHDFHRKTSTPPGEDHVSDEDWRRLEKIKGLSELFDDVLFWCWHVKVGDAYKVRQFRAAQNRFVVITALVKPEIFNHDSYDKIAEKLGTTKALLSFYAKEFQAEVGLKFQRSKKDDNGYSESSKKAWQERKKK